MTLRSLRGCGSARFTPGRLVVAALLFLAQAALPAAQLVLLERVVESVDDDPWLALAGLYTELVAVPQGRFAEIFDGQSTEGDRAR